jgi:hypothetical protein
VKVLNAPGKSERENVKAFNGIYGAELSASTKDRNEGLVEERIKDVKNHFGKYWKCFKSAIVT